MKRQAFIFYHKETDKKCEEGKEKEIELKFYLWFDPNFKQMKVNLKKVGHTFWCLQRTIHFNVL